MSPGSYAASLFSKSSVKNFTILLSLIKSPNVFKLYFAYWLSGCPTISILSNSILLSIVLCECEKTNIVFSGSSCTNGIVYPFKNSRSSAKHASSLYRVCFNNCRLNANVPAVAWSLP